MRDQRGREAGVTDGADVGAAIAEAGHRVGVAEHLAGRVEVAVRIVEERQVEQCSAVVREEQIDVELDRVDAQSRRPRRDGVFPDTSRWPSARKCSR